MQVAPFKVILAFLAIFFSGVALGYVISDLNLKILTQDSVERPAEETETARQRLIDYLELDENQREPFFIAFRAYRNDIRDLMRTNRRAEQEEIRTRFDQFHSDLEIILTEEQIETIKSRMHPDSLRNYDRRGAQRGEQMRGRSQMR